MERDQRRAPLFEALAHHAGSGASSFHVPGHKSGQGGAADAEAFYHAVMRIDLTEIPGLDDLHHPEGVIRDAQQLAARAFGADETFFLVGGSTAGNIACLMAVLDPGDLVLVQRDVHRSVLNGIMLAGARAVFIRPRVHPESGLSLGLDAADAEQALRQYPEAKALFVTNPTYYGVSVDVRALAELAHRHGIPLIVDEAHGAHFGFHPRLPANAVASGADAAVQSSHKMLSAMTMGAMLHLRGGRIDAGRVRSVLGMLQSSSPSYPIMASLDLCRRDMALNGKERIGNLLPLLDELAGHLSAGGIAVPRRLEGTCGSIAQDPFKMALYDPDGILTGFDLYNQLAERGCYAELADLHHALLAFSPYTSERDIVRLKNAVFGMRREKTGSKKELAAARANIYIEDFIDPISEPVSLIPPYRRTGPEVRLMSREQAAGLPSADMITPYPPGIPLLYPGEMITPQAVEVLARLHAAGARIYGLRDPELRTLAVLDRP